MIRKKTRNRRMLHNKKSFIFLLILCLGIGFSFLSSQLTITGNTSVSGNKWSVYFDNVKVRDGSVDANTPEIDTNKTTINFTVALDKPGDYYEFTVDAKNDGTIDAIIGSVTKTELDANIAKYLNYTVTYDNELELKQNDILVAKDKTTYKVLVEYKKNITASDLSEESINLNLSFTVNYAQSDKKPESFATMAKKNALNDTSIDFKQVSSDTNGKGLYLLSGTENDTNPIYYYRGEVYNNNALFAGYCWKIVRTTETGGTKLIYNGEPKKAYLNSKNVEKDSYANVENAETYPFTFDSTNNEWQNKNDTHGSFVKMTFTMKEAGDYYFNYKITASEGDYVGIYIYRDGSQLKYIYQTGEGTIELFDLTESTEIKIEYFREYYEGEGTSNAIFSVAKGLGESVVGCTNTTGTSMLISSNTKYNDSSRSIAHVGYMYGEVNNFNDKSLDSSYLFGSSFTYANGTYTLQSTQDSTDSTHHYTCFNTTGTCSEVYYIYYTYPYTPYMSTYYVTLTNGKSVEDLINEALVNTSESTIKTKLDDWFINTFATSFTNLGKNYNDYLEDTVWCNDRSINEVSSDVFSSFEESGWNPNGGETTGSGSKSHALNFGIIGRLLTGTPTLTCPNKKDAFTVNNSTNGNSLLSYPVGTLTADEVMLAGGQYNIYDDNVRNYLKSGWSWWTLSPSTYYGFYGTSNARILMVSASGNLYAEGTESAIGLRPSISIVPSIKIATGGDGSAVNPYKFLID